ncbi:hypothetical protein KCP76_22755 [Salmonella enterica subsp. enterica serovar Weltevreden]|nr:hypothetical protein KCP76_22755 [Salmonella enterica subsp. enterica serovar Weltevreden]
MQGVFRYSRIAGALVGAGCRVCFVRFDMWDINGYDGGRFQTGETPVRRNEGFSGRFSFSRVCGRWYVSDCRRATRLRDDGTGDMDRVR